MRKHDYDTLYDLVRIGKSFEEFRADFTTKTDDIDKLAVVNKGEVLYFLGGAFAIY